MARVTKHDVLRVFDADPTKTSVEIAQELDCCDAYVRATLKRNDRVLLNARGPVAPEDRAKRLRRRAAKMLEEADMLFPVCRNRKKPLATFEKESILKS